MLWFSTEADLMYHMEWSTNYHIRGIASVIEILRKRFTDRLKHCSHNQYIYHEVVCQLNKRQIIWMSSWSSYSLIKAALISWEGLCFPLQVPHCPVKWQGSWILTVIFSSMSVFLSIFCKNLAIWIQASMWQLAIFRNPKQLRVYEL